MRDSAAMLPSSGPTQVASLPRRLRVPRRRARSRDPVRRHGAAWWGGLLVSGLVHALLFALWPEATIVLEGAGARDAVRAFDRPDPIRLLRLAIPADEMAPVEGTVRTEEAARDVSARPQGPRGRNVAVRQVPASGAALDLARASPLPARRGLALPGRRGASGSSTADEEQFVRPVARFILPNWRAPRSLHGLVVTARVHVDASGDPTGPVELVPPTRHRELDRRIADRVGLLEYQPARRNGEPVAAWAEITFVFCHAGVRATSPAPRRLPEAPCDPRKSRSSEVAPP